VYNLTLRSSAIHYSNNNPFHNFEHASHVTMSVQKMLTRIIETGTSGSTEEDLREGYKASYGISADPLTHFAAVLSALIHDVDHYGVPNSHLVDQKHELAAAYKNKSVAEQHSIDISWGLLMTGPYEDLRRAIFQTNAELARFRQVVVTSVLATDIMDSKLKELRNKRWALAFSEGTTSSSVSSAETSKLRATTVLIHLIQASDVSHTMQHWHIYRKVRARTNRRLLCRLRPYPTIF